MTDTKEKMSIERRKTKGIMSSESDTNYESINETIKNSIINPVEDSAFIYKFVTADH